MTLRRPLSAVLRAWLHAASRRTARRPRGPVRLRGLDAPVSVGFDQDGVPHIRAQSDADAFFAHGYCHAIDRYFQMDMLRRVLSGRLSEVVGQRSLGDLGSTVSADHLMRALDLRGSAQRVVDNGEDEDRRLMNAYVAGVNQGIERWVRRNRPIEHRLARLPMAPWTLTDSVLIAKGMSLGLSFKWRTAQIYAAIADVLDDDPKRLAEILPPAHRAEIDEAFVRLGGAFEGLLDLLPGPTAAHGSNAFVVGAGRSASGKPLLASDPHLSLSLPSVWYLSSVRGTAYQAVGASLPGLPGIVLGRTPGVAWGLTNGMIDDADLWQEEIDDSGKRYRVDGAWLPLQVDTQSIPRRGRSPHLIRVRRTHRGPILTDAFPGYEGPPLSIRMTLHDVTDDLQAFLALGRSRTVDEALVAIDGFGSPAQNVVLADTRGDAAYRLMGRVPMRTFGAHPSLPQDGTTRESDWTGVIASAQMPAGRLSPDDVVVTANDPHTRHDDAYLSHLYEPSYRAARIRSLLMDARGLTADDLAAAQIDSVDLGMRRFRERIIEPLADAARKTKPTHGPLLDCLLTWDGDSSVDARGAVVAHLLYHHLARRTFAPALGESLTLRWMGQMNLVDNVLHTAFADEDSAWAPHAVRPTLFMQALDDTVQALRRNNLQLDSPWGAWHTLFLEHPAGRKPVLADVFSRGPMPVPGAPFTPNSGQYYHSSPGKMVVGASYRHVIDMAAPESGRMILVGGQSGHVGSPNYDNQIQRWVNGEGIPMRLETEPPNAKWLTLVPG